MASQSLQKPPGSPEPTGQATVPTPTIPIPPQVQVGNPSLPRIRGVWLRIDPLDVESYADRFGLPKSFGIGEMVRLDLLKSRRNPKTDVPEYQITDNGFESMRLKREAETSASTIA